MPIAGTVQLTGQVAPTALTDTYPTHDAVYGLDGHRSVADATARNAITTGRCRKGMLVALQSDLTVWQLNTATPTGTNADWTAFAVPVLPKYVRGATWSGQGIALSAGADNVAITCQAAGTILSVTTIGVGGVGSCVIDIWKTTFTGALPTSANSITASAKPTIAAGVEVKDTTLTGWTTTVAAGDVLVFNLVSASIFRTITVLLEIQ